jgi:acyl-CoA thioester hydrolase
MQAHETSVRVRYAETDQMGVAYYANYFIWMEVGRVEFCHALGFRYREMEAEDGVLLAVVEAHCRYLAPARYDDEVVIKTWVEAVTPRMVRFGYAMRAGNRTLASGETKHIFCGRDFKPRRLPEKYRVLFGIGRAANGAAQMGSA